MEIIGDLCDIRGEINFEWKIKDFLQLPKVCKSPEFSVFGASWEIWIFPYGRTSDKSVGWISLYILSKSKSEHISVDFSFQLKTADGKSDTYAEFTDTYVLNKPNKGCIFSKIISRSKLIERKTELLPSGILTIICILKKRNTNDEYGSTVVDEFTQTEEETGVLKLQQNFKEMLESGNVSDVVLKVEDQEFKSHRCVLAARSPVFQAMMTHDTKEKNTGVVDIQDTDPNTFFDFLKYTVN